MHPFPISSYHINYTGTLPINSILLNFTNMMAIGIIKHTCPYRGITEYHSSTVNKRYCYRMACIAKRALKVTHVTEQCALRQTRCCLPVVLQLCHQRLLQPDHHTQTITDYSPALRKRFSKQAQPGGFWG